jgi:3-hydroxybutyryl-CoA dehydratase
MTLAVGDTVEHAFVIDDAAMRTFSALSGDSSAVHVDDVFARSRGFEGAIVYGGLMLAQLSFVLGSRIPGDHGVSTRWSIDYRRALYVGQQAVLRLEITDISPATGIVETKFTISAGGRVIATGKTQSLVPLEDLARS